MRKLSPIWAASSRVGDRISARQVPRAGALGLGGEAAAGSAARRRPSCRCRSGQCQAGRGLRAGSGMDLRLDGGGGLVALGGQRLEKGFGEFEFAKCGHVQFLSCFGTVGNARTMSEMAMRGNRARPGGRCKPTHVKGMFGRSVRSEWRTRGASRIPYSGPKTMTAHMGVLQRNVKGMFWPAPADRACR